MGIEIIKTPTIHLTQSQLNRYREEYRRAFMMYAGTPPDFEEWVIARGAIQETRTLWSLTAKEPEGSGE
jgi:hypothetical protein